VVPLHHLLWGFIHVRALFTTHTEYRERNQFFKSFISDWIPHSRVPPCVALDDLVSAGTIGLMQAVDRFQPSRGLQFGTYARHRIWGAMLDFLRGEDPLSRAERREVRAGRADRPSAATISLEELPAFEPRSARCTSYTFTDRVDLERARQRLSAREQQVVSLLFDLDWSNREVARELGVNESRVSQIKHAALSKLRESLRNRNYRRAAA
jgi:RNA polymerase sigma factor for flagellar operon FliA